MGMQVDVGRIRVLMAHVHAPKNAPYSSSPDYNSDLRKSGASIVGRQIIDEASIYRRIETDFDTIHEWRVAVLDQDEAAIPLDFVAAAEAKARDFAREIIEANATQYDQNGDRNIAEILRTIARTITLRPTV